MLHQLQFLGALLHFQCTRELSSVLEEEWVGRGGGAGQVRQGRGGASEEQGG